MFGRLVKDISQQENVAEETSAVKIKPVYSAETVKLICKGPYRKVYEERERERVGERVLGGRVREIPMRNIQSVTLTYIGHHVDLKCRLYDQ